MSETRKTALVTGASGGIGRTFAVALAREGWAVTVVARSADRLAQLVAELGEGHRALAADLSTREGVASVQAELAAHRYDLLVNNAGIGIYGAFHASDLDRQQAMIDLNIDALVALAHTFLKDARSGDTLINVSSTLAFMPMPYSSAYTATKAFVTAFSDCLWYENKDRGVYVMGLHPGVTRTAFHENAGGSDTNRPPERLVQSPEEVVDAALAAMRSRSDSTVISGFVNKAGSFLFRFFTRKGMVSAMGANAPQR